MRDRLAEIFTWTTGKYAFDEAIVPRSTNAFAPSLLHVIVESVYRAFTRDRLLEKVDRFMNKKLQRSERFEEVIDQMDLTKPQLSAAERLAEGKPLAQLLKKHANDSQLFLLMTYVLTEMDLLLAPLE
jgi:uncharacterized protein VirK/YbjX